ncbi:MAG: DMT family transporter [Alphaproteobacteria bacterium]
MFAHFNDTQKGIFYALIGYTAFAFNDVNAKWLVQSLPQMQVNCLQALSAAIFLLLVQRFMGGWKGIDNKKQRPIHILRGFTNFALSVLLVYSFGLLSLADIYAMIFTVPFIAVILSRIFYGEFADKASWGAIIVGFIGVLFVLQPGFDMNIYLLLPLGAALGVAINAVSAKSLQGASPFLLSFIPLSMTFVLAAPFMLMNFDPLTARHIFHFALGGVLLSMAITFVSLAFRTAQSHRVTPFLYTEIIWGLLFGYMIFGDVPNSLMLIGTAIIIASGFFVILHNHRQMKKAAAQ